MFGSARARDPAVRIGRRNAVMMIELPIPKNGSFKTD